MKRILIILTVLMYIGGLSAQNIEKEYWPGKEKKGEGPVVNGKKNGKWTYWYENKKKWCEGDYKDNEQTALWNYWFMNGKQWEVINYDNGLNTRW